jgi:hypothetical protein
VTLGLSYDDSVSWLGTPLLLPAGTILNASATMSSERQ